MDGFFGDEPLTEMSGCRKDSTHIRRGGREPRSVRGDGNRGSERRMGADARQRIGNHPRRRPRTRENDTQRGESRRARARDMASAQGEGEREQREQRESEARLEVKIIGAIRSLR